MWDLREFPWSDDFVFVLIIGCICAVFLAFVAQCRQKCGPATGFPPGPRGLPFVGIPLFFRTKPHLHTLKWKERYGDSYSLGFGSQPMVILNNINTIRRVFFDDAASGRNTNKPDKPGLVNSEGNLWKIHRRFAITTLRNLCTGKNWLEEIILTEVEDLCFALKNTNQNAFDPKVPLTNSVANIMCALIFGQRFPLNDPNFCLLTSFIQHNTDAMKWRFVVQTLPFLTWFPNSVRKKVAEARSNLDHLREFLLEKIREHETVRGLPDNVPDYVRVFQKEKVNVNRLKAERDTFTEKQLLASLLDLFSAGTETTATTLLWGLVFLIENPDVMLRAQTEIDEKLGQSTHVGTSSIGQLPYTEAVILEIQRCASILPLGAVHKTLQKMTIDGCTIPPGTLLAANIYGVHHDSRYWNHPDTFNPARFLDENFKLKIPEGFAPFSFGKRACPGEALAKMELFLFLTNLIRRFDFQLNPGKTLSHMDCVSSVTLSPKPFQLFFIPRVKNL